MISIASPVYDPNGELIFPDETPENAYQASRRGSVTATLDGGSWPYDTGFSVSDQTVTLSITNASEAILVKLRYLIAYYSELIVSIDTGCYSARCSFASNRSVLTLTMRLLSRLDS
jgi:hypothetical protein